MRREQRILLHSVIAHGLTNLRGRKLVIESELMSRQKYYTSGKDDHENEVIRCLEKELKELDNKLEIGTLAMLELEGVRGMSAPMMGDASELQDQGVRGMSAPMMGDASELQEELTGILGQQLTQMFVNEEERRQNTPHLVVARTVRAVGTFEVGDTFLYRGDAVMVFKKGEEYRYIQSGKVVPEPFDPDKPLVDVLVQPIMLWVEE